ncbi:MAG: type II secretion system protein GspN [Bdellovibrio sp.]|nr:type II secretion system protein GspN [Bdellovibrio sp.]
MTTSQKDDDSGSSTSISPPKEPGSLTGEISVERSSTGLVAEEGSSVTIEALPTPDETESSEPIPPPTRLRKIGRFAGWALTTLFLLVMFTWIKLPDDKIKNDILGTITSELAHSGISVSTTETDLSLLFGLSFTLKNALITLPQPNPAVRIERLEISPSLIGALFRKMAGEIQIRNGEGRLRGAFSFSGTKGSIRVKAEKLEIQKLGVLPFLAGIQGGGTLDGEGDLSGDFNLPSTLGGQAHFTAKKITLESQSIAGFLIPKIFISEGELEANLDKGKGPIKALKLGKPGNSKDDLIANLTGDLSLAATWPSSGLNAKVRFGISETVMKAFPILDALLGQAKESDGSYSYSLSGTLDGLVPTPLGGGSLPSLLTGSPQAGQPTGDSVQSPPPGGAQPSLTKENTTSSD